MSLVVASLMLATSYVTPNPVSDIVTFQMVVAAEKVCPDLKIDVEGTLDHLVDLRQSAGWTAAQFYEASQSQKRVAEFHAGHDRDVWCSSVQDRLRSYDPAYLRKVGVIK
ncbi:hypothetical protein [Rhizobium sp. SSA_523]|uniref:hypothetical protein n=1 Tax=Rhizobium sp. SSA_523 TaxID=2952477 RepID=UPI002090CA06|nr:hypothetical protein [Rhizobium sp. SSA_523]MCO5730118.1 hypothetical protein [Rhizobium sp. SSA_523]WKC25183.1 hypothetical protein QTJ18_14440 [Rhizobium sp. SSA_523]